MSKSPFTAEQREMISLAYINGSSSAKDLAVMYGVDEYTVRRWAQRYKCKGIYAFMSNGNNKQYSAEFKKFCVELYLSGSMSVSEIVAHYDISTNSVLEQWILRYNANRELKDYCPNKEVYMASARRKTTIEERKEIVKYCIEHNHDYKGTAGIYDVSYSQVYSWVKKYEANGEDTLNDKRGRHKTDDEVDELERLRRENIRLKRQLEEKDMLAELLKKVQEFERM